MIRPVLLCCMMQMAYGAISNSLSCIDINLGLGTNNMGVWGTRVCGYYWDSTCPQIDISNRPYCCTACPYGSYCDGFGSKQLCSNVCPTGQYRTQSCQLCTDHVCSPCGTGYWCQGTQRFSCKSCSRGVQTACSSTADTVCVPDGYYKSGASILQCAQCAAGTYVTSACVTSNTVCSASCGAGYYCPGNGNRYACSSCARGIVTACTATQDAQCVPDGFFLNGATVQQCSACQQGKYMTTQCVTADTACSACPVNSYCVGSKALNVIDVCPVNSTSVSGAKGIDDCVFNCANGTFISNYACQSCSPCADYEFKSGGCKNTTDTICTRNPPPDCICNFTKGVDYANCRCKPGLIGRATSWNTSTCTLCPAGNYCPGLEPDESCPC